VTGEVAPTGVHTVDGALLDHVDALSAPRVVDAWERNPCDRALFEGIGLGSLGLEAHGVGGNVDRRDRGLLVDAKFAADAYRVSIVPANGAAGWLTDAGLTLSDVGRGPVLFARGDASALPFVDGATVLPPLRFDAPTLSVPFRLLPLDGSGAMDVFVYVIAPQRYEADTMPKAFAPTNLELPPDAWSHVDDAYDTLFVHTLVDHPGAAVTEYAGSFTSCRPCASIRYSRGLHDAPVERGRRRHRRRGRDGLASALEAERLRRVCDRRDGGLRENFDGRDRSRRRLRHAARCPHTS
jgi:hypothetical protein